MKPICVPCERFYRLKKNGYYFIEGMPVGTTQAEPGKAEPEKWKPYKVWQGDLWECPTCRATIVVGTGFEPLSVQHMPDFQQWITSSGASQLLVKDC